MKNFVHPSERGFSAEPFTFQEPRCFCFSSSSSSSRQETATVSGASATGQQAATAGDLSTVQTGGTRNEGSGQVGGVRADGSGNVGLAGGSRLNTGQVLNLGARATTGAITINSGVGQDALSSLVGTLTRASDRQVAALAESGDKTTSILGELLSQKQDEGAGNPRTLAGVAVAGLAAILLVVYFRR